MIVYLTQLATTTSLTQEVLIRTILANANCSQVDSLVASLPATGIKKVHPINVQKSLVIASDEGRKLTAIRYTIQEPAGNTFVQDYVLDENKHFLFIQCDIQNVWGQEQPSKQIFQSIPKVIHRMIYKNLLDQDSLLPISNQPIFITEENAADIIALLKNETHCKLPIVCISPSLIGRYPVAIEQTATQLAGLAHVAVIRDKKTAALLKENGLNISSCHGNVFVHCSGEKEISTVVFSDKKHNHIKQLLQEVLYRKLNHTDNPVISFDQVYEMVLTEQILQSEKNCREAQIAQKIAEAKHSHLLAHLDEETQRLNEEAMEKALQEAETIVSSYEEDIELLRDNLYEKNLLLQGVEVENQRLRSHLDQGKIPVIYLGQEKEFYLGEIQDLLLSTLEDALEDIPAKSKKRDVITDILNSNNYRHISKSRNEQVKNLLKSYDGMSAKIRHGLEELGFQVEETNKHCKISYHGDNRYLVVFGSTPSDVRTGKNNASTLARMAY